MYSYSMYVIVQISREGAFNSLERISERGGGTHNYIMRSPLTYVPVLLYMYIIIQYPIH